MTPRPITALVTGAGAPGILGTLHCLRENPDGRKVRIIGTDIAENVVGSWLADAFHTVPRPEDTDAFLSRILEICEEESVDVIMPQVTRELEVFAAYRKRFEVAGVQVAVGSSEAMGVANSKSRLSKLADEVGCPTPPWHHVADEAGLRRAAEALGYPESRVVVKPPVSNGMRGFRVLDANVDRFRLWRDEKPSGIHSTLDDLMDVFSGHPFPELTVTAYLPGDEFTVDLLGKAGRPIVVVPRRRLQVRSGITFRGRVEEHEAVLSYSKTLGDALGLDHCYGFQFKLDDHDVPRLLECNPRIQGTMALAAFAGANVVYGAMCIALDEPVPKMDVRWGTELVRYWGGVAAIDGIMVGRL